MLSQVEGWTDARFKAFIVSAIRSGFRRYPNKYLALKNAATKKKVNKDTGRIAQHYRCAACRKEYTAKNVQVDHVQPVVDKEFVDWNTYIQRMYCAASNLQVLCLTCHKAKTKLERTKTDENPVRTVRRRNTRRVAQGDDPIDTKVRASRGRNHPNKRKVR